ncbi:MAG TPA: tetratricopeptide repeat protein, partial [Planctomycetota bacterium]|nr:tetratricopeptide repeat protein [Planctomycetota bacterium]
MRSRAVLLAALLLVAAGGRAAAFDDLDDIWNDPVFQRQFVGSYGINAEIEPRLSPEEILLLETIRPLMADDLPQAEAALKAQMKPESSATLDYTLGGIAFQQDRLDEALACYERAVAKFPSFRRAWRNVGLIHVRNGEYDAGIQAFTKMIELGGGDAYSYGLLGFAYSAKEDYQPAEASYRNALLLQPDSEEWRLGLAQCVFKQDKYEDAASLLDSLLERYPDNENFWLLQAHAYLGLERPLDAARNLEAMDFIGKASVDSLHTLGDIYVNESLLDLAENAYERAIDKDASQPLSRPLRAAEVLAARGGTKQSRQLVAHVHSAFDATMTDADRRALLKLEARLSMTEGVGNAETATVLEEIVQLDPLDGEALMLLGQHYSQQNEPDRAIFYYERAAGLEQYAVEASIRHAQTLVGMGRYAEAIPLLR